MEHGDSLETGLQIVAVLLVCRFDVDDYAVHFVVWLGMPPCCFVGRAALLAGLNLADGVAGIGAGTWTVGLERCCRVCFSSAVRSRQGELPRPLMEAACLPENVLES